MKNQLEVTQIFIIYFWIFCFYIVLINVMKTAFPQMKVIPSGCNGCDLLLHFSGSSSRVLPQGAACSPPVSPSDSANRQDSGVDTGLTFNHEAQNPLADKQKRTYTVTNWQHCKENCLGLTLQIFLKKNLFGRKLTCSIQLPRLVLLYLVHAHQHHRVGSFACKLSFEKIRSTDLCYSLMYKANMRLD